MERQEEFPGDLALRKPLFQQAQNIELAVGEISQLVTAAVGCRQGLRHRGHEVADDPGAGALRQHDPGLVQQGPRPVDVA